MKSLLKKIRNISCIGIFAVMLGLSGCQDEEFLEQTPETFYTVENIFSTADQVDQVLMGVYSRIKEIWVIWAAGQEYMNFKQRGTDILTVPQGRRGQAFSDYSTVNADYATFRMLYNDFYMIIARTNLAIQAADLPQISWVSESEKAYILAQARFFRAFMYKNLAELWGGVPLVTEVVSSPRYDYVRASRLETYQFAIDELEAILDDLPETTPHGGRIVRGAAQHNLCELYLAKGTQQEAEGDAGAAKASYAQAISYGNQLIDGSIYSLMNERFGARKNEQTISIDIHPSGNISADVVDTVTMVTNHYWDLFQEGSVNYQDGNRECIWAFQIDYEMHKVYNNSRMAYSQIYCPVLRDGSNGHIAGMLEDIGGRPNSNTSQTWHVRDGVWADKWGDDLRNSDIVFRRRFKGNVPPSGGNPRPYYLKPIPWDVFYNGADNEQTNMNNRSLCFPISCKITTDKFVGTNEGQIRQNLFRDDYAIRLSETVLLRAEAKQRNGDKAGAAADINLLRNRARCSYLVTPADVDDKFDLILDERIRELIYEECRWNTLLRMGGTVAVDRIKKCAFWPETVTTLTFNYNLWPIPQSIIDVNKDVPMAQNPGWDNR